MSRKELETTWEAIRGHLKRAATDLTFHLWLEPLELVGREEQALYVRAPRHIRTLVQERHLPLLRTAATEVLGRPVAIEVVDESWSPEAVMEHGPTSLVGARVTAAADLLNPKYTFDQFVIGDANRLAHAAALAVAEQPGHAYNPLFLHGPPGLGKTHLLHAIGNYVRRYGAGVTVRYATSDEFTSSYVRAVREGGVSAFKSSFRGVDVLLLDDVQFLGGREKTQDELFHTFNALYDGGCQLVVSSDRPPGEMATFERRLVERFASGLIAELDPPLVDVRLAILRKRVVLDGLPNLDEETLREVAELVPTSVRALEGALIRVIAYTSVRGISATPALVHEVLGRLYPRAETPLRTVRDVREATAIAFGLSPEALVAHDRRPQVAHARQVAMYLARELTDHSLPAIGADFGGRNHSTVLHAHRKIAAEMTSRSAAARVVAELRSKLEQPDPDRA